MDRLIAPNSVDLAHADTAPATGTPQYATDGNPATGVPATLWPAYAFNTIQDEIYNVIIAAGLTPDRTRWNQLLTAIQTMLQGATTNVGVDTGAANAYVVAFTPALSAPVPWAPFWVKIKTANTGASTLNATGTAEPLVGGAHQTLQGGELVANGNALIYWNPTLNSGSGAYVLAFCTGAPEQIAPATASEHALQAGQALGLYLGTQIIDSSQTVNPGTYTVGGRSVTATRWRVRGAGSAGAGAGAAATGSSTISVGTGGQGGACCEFWMTATATSVTVGAAGAPGAAGANGGAGGTSSFGSLATVPGGVGGIVAGPAVPPFVQPTLSATGAPTGSATFVEAKAGSLLGTTASATSTSAFLSGSGGPSDQGTGGNATNGGSGTVGSGKGAGGSGAANPVSTAASVGGAGLPARWIVDEFA